MTTKLTSPIDFIDWNERASAAGKLYTNPPGKTPMEKYEDCLKKIAELEVKEKLIASQLKTLSELKAELPILEAKKFDIILSTTAKSHLNEVYWERRTGVRRDIHSEYMENGKFGEQYAIKLISELDDPDLFEMGEQIYEKCGLPRQRNNHFEGECDIKKSPAIQDIKCAWDIFTYYPHVNELIFKKDEEGKVISKWEWSEEKKAWVLPTDNIENDTYLCQGVVYMELYGESEFWLRYCLVDMPEELLTQQFRYIARDFGGNTEHPDCLIACDDFKSRHKFGHLPIDLRVCTFKIQRNNALYLELCRRVEKAREYLNWYSQEMFWLENPGNKPHQEVFFSKTIELPITERLQESIGIWREAVAELEKEDTKTEIKIDSVVGEIKQKESHVNDAVPYISGGIIPTFDENNFPDVLDTIEKEENSVKTIIAEEFLNPLKEVKMEIHPNVDIEAGEPIRTMEVNFGNTISSYQSNEAVASDDPFILQINSLKTIESFTEFYMENAERIDDKHPYEEYFYEKKNAILDAKEAPKAASAPKPGKVSSPVPVQQSPQKVYTGLETYVISDGVKDITAPFSFSEAQSFILHHAETICSGYKKYEDLRDGITTFFNANKEVIERDLGFKAKFSDLTKKYADAFIEARRKEMLDRVSKM